MLTPLIRSLPLLLTICLLMGCTSSVQLRDDATAAPVTVDELNRKTYGRYVRVTLLDQQWLEGRVHFSTDSLRVTAGTQITHVPLAQVHVLDIPRRRRGRRIGLGAGLAVGVGLAVLVATSGSGEAESDGNCTLGECNLLEGIGKDIGRGFIAALAIPTTMALGALIGGHAGKERIVLNEH
jgi:hypothetical protein